MQILPLFELVISLCIFLQNILNEIDLPININSYFIIILQETIGISLSALLLILPRVDRGLQF
jgi:hypothetical protein